MLSCHLPQVRALVDSLGAEVGSASPSIAVQMGGFGAVPTAGDEFAVRLEIHPRCCATWLF